MFNNILDNKRKLAYNTNFQSDNLLAKLLDLKFINSFYDMFFKA